MLLLLILFCLGSSFNYYFSFIMYKDFALFLIREIFLCIAILLKYKYPKEISSIIKDIQHIDNVIEEKYPVLKYQTICFLLGFGLFFFIPFLPVDVEDQPGLFLLAYLFILLTGLLMFYRMLVSFATPELHPYFNIRDSVRLHGFRSFSTSSKLLVVCTRCFYGTLGTCFVLIGGPKIVTINLDVRSPFSNLISGYLLYDGIVAKSEYSYDLAFQIRQEDPSYNFNGPDGLVDRKLCYKYYLDRGKPIPKPKSFLGLTIEVEHSLDTEAIREGIKKEIIKAPKTAKDIVMGWIRPDDKN